MRGYEDVLPGAAERIMLMAEKQSSHRIAMEETIVKRTLNQKTSGLIIGSILALVILGLTLYFAILGLVWLAGILATTTLLTTICVFILGKQPRANDKVLTETQKPTKK